MNIPLIDALGLDNRQGGYIWSIESSALLIFVPFLHPYIPWAARSRNFLRNFLCILVFSKSREKSAVPRNHARLANFWRRGSSLHEAIHREFEEMKESDVLACQIQEWYPRFQKVSIKTIIHPLPESFVEYLLDDGGLFLPKTTDAMPARTKIQWPDLQAEDYSPWKEEETEEDEPHVPTFPDFENEVKQSIASLGGYVFPKLNWSAPKDTAWISSNGTLKCSSFSEIALLLRASDSLVHDLCHAFDSCEDKTVDRPAQFFLALRKWYDLRPEMEFRGFVRGGFLVGISQREVTGFYPSLLDKRAELESSIFQFFNDNISGAFQPLDYAFDCYVTKDGRVRLIDFNPWGAFTLPLLFSWEELQSNYEQVLERLNDWKLLEADGVSADSEKAGNNNREKAPLDSNVLCSSDKGMENSWCEPRVEYPGKTCLSLKLREEGHRVEFRIVDSQCRVQPSLKAAGGVPYDYIDTSAGSAWDEFLRKADEEVKKQTKAPAAGA